MSNIIIKELRFSNILSFGDNNVLDFTKSRVTQLVGLNGAGKSSIATILEEVAYSKNSRGIKKADLFSWNRDKHYSITLLFSKDGTEYSLHKEVKNATKLVLLRDGEDISGHTATQTYKIVEEDIFGCDFTTFTRLIYQSIGSSLDFLKASDAKRKEFLVSLFDQEIYKETATRIKDDLKGIKLELAELTGSEKTLSAQISNLRKQLEGDIPEAVSIPEYNDAEDVERVSDLRVTAALAEETNAMIRRQRSLDRSVKDAETNFLKLEKPSEEIEQEDVNKLLTELSVVTSEASKVKSRYKRFKEDSSNTSCPTCGTTLDKSDSERAMLIAKEEYLPLMERRDNLTNITNDLRERLSYQREYTKAKDTYYNLLFERDQNTIEEDSIVDIEEVKAQILDIQNKITSRKLEIDKARALDLKIQKMLAVRTSAVQSLGKLLEEYGSVCSSLKDSEDKTADLELYAKSMSDLVAYKLEYSVKHFEELINQYLSILTDGKFALTFELSSTKLNVIIYNQGIETNINSCSTGQQQRIQLATLLAIRNLMGAISKVNINLLFLDEVISFLDSQGMETLIELLLKEQDLNSFIVSHGHSHPLTDKVTVKMDEDLVSRLEYGN